MPETTALGAAMAAGAAEGIGVWQLEKPDAMTNITTDIFYPAIKQKGQYIDYSLWLSSSLKPDLILYFCWTFLLTHLFL